MEEYILKVIGEITERVKRVNPENPDHLVFGAELRCVHGDTHSYLIIPTNDLTVNNLPNATIAHSEKDVNIMPFGMCNVSGSYAEPCREVMDLEAQWINKGKQNMDLGDDEVITMDSRLWCKHGILNEEIVPVDPGQLGLFAEHYLWLCEMDDKYDGLFTILSNPDKSIYLDGNYVDAISLIEEIIGNGNVDLLKLNKNNPRDGLLLVTMQALFPNLNMDPKKVKAGNLIGIDIDPRVNDLYIDLYKLFPNAGNRPNELLMEKNHFIPNLRESCNAYATLLNCGHHPDVPEFHIKTIFAYKWQRWEFQSERYSRYERNKKEYNYLKSLIETAGINYVLYGLTSGGGGSNTISNTLTPNSSGADIVSSSGGGAAQNNSPIGALPGINGNNPIDSAIPNSLSSGVIGDSNYGEGSGLGSTGRTIPNSLEEQMAMKEVKSNPLKGATQIPIKMTDQRWSAEDGWIKMQRVVTTSKGRITIHFVYNKKTGAFDDFKFK